MCLPFQEGSAEFTAKARGQFQLFGGLPLGGHPFLFAGLSVCHFFFACVFACFLPVRSCVCVCGCWFARLPRLPACPPSCLPARSLARSLACLLASLFICLFVFLYVSHSFQQLHLYSFICMFASQQFWLCSLFLDQLYALHASLGYQLGAAKRPVRLSCRPRAPSFIYPSSVSR